MYLYKHNTMIDLGNMGQIFSGTSGINNKDQMIAFSKSKVRSYTYSYFIDLKDLKKYNRQ